MERPRTLMIAGAVVIFILTILVIVFAALYGSVECETSGSSSGGGGGSGGGGPAMTMMKLNMDNMMKLSHTPAKAWMKTMMETKDPHPGKQMQVNLMRLDAGPPLEYTHWYVVLFKYHTPYKAPGRYEGIMYVLKGSLRISNGTGNFFNATQGQSMYIPRGAKVSYESIAQSSHLYIVIQPPTLERVTEIQAAMGTDLSVIGQPRAMTLYPDLPLLPNQQNSSSYLEDILLSEVKGSEMSGGLYKLLSGPALEYTYEYEEFKLIIEGEFHLKDGTGKQVVAKVNDLLYFPKDTFVRFASPKHGLGFYVGQRKGGTA